MVGYSSEHGHTRMWCLVAYIHCLSLFFSASWRYWSSIFEYIQKKSRTCALILAAERLLHRSLFLSLSLSLSHCISSHQYLLIHFLLFVFLHVYATIFWHVPEIVLIVVDEECFDQFGLPTLSCSVHGYWLMKREWTYPIFCVVSFRFVSDILLNSRYWLLIVVRVGNVDCVLLPPIPHARISCCCY